MMRRPIPRKELSQTSYGKLMSCPRNKHIFRCDQNGPPARREEGAYLERYVTDEQRSRRPIFIATLRAATSWLFFRVARSLRIDLRYARRSRLEKQPTDPATAGRKACLFRDRTPAAGLETLRRKRFV